MSETITFVIPVYNAAATIETTIESVLNQKLVDFCIEIVLVDDASTDGSAKIIETYSLKPEHSNRIMLLRNKTNRGVSFCRNLGICIAHGDYIVFLDADDIIDGCFSSKLIERFRLSYMCSFVFCGFSRVTASGKILKRYSPMYKYCNRTDSKSALSAYLSGSISPCIGSFMVRRELIIDNGLRFSSGCSHGEDQEFISKLLFFSNQVDSVQEELMYYVQSDDSVTRRFDMRILDSVGAFSRVRAFLTSNGCDGTLLQMVDEVRIPYTLARAVCKLIGSQYEGNVFRMLKRPGTKCILRKARPHRSRFSCITFLAARLALFPSVFRIACLMIRNLSNPRKGG